MNINFGLFPPIEDTPQHADGRRIKGKERGKAKKKLMAERAVRDLETWLASVKD